MDVAEISKVGNRKRMSADVEKLREKVAKENKKIIKLKVAQDTAYWDLKEKLRQVETNYEKLQQNMLEVQMQYETVSGQYQDELRHRAETLNKLASNREICTVLEDYTERLRDTLSRCKADQAALYDAYQQTGQMIRDMKNQQRENDDKNKMIIENLQEKLKLTTEHHNQLLQYFGEEKQRAVAEINALKEKLGTMAARFNDLINTNSELKALLEQGKRELEKKEETILNLHRDNKQILQNFNTQATEMKNNMQKLEKELQEFQSENESLKQALKNQEIFTQTVCEQSNQLQEKLAALEDEQENSKKIVKGLEAQLQEAKKANEHLKNEAATLVDKNENLEKVIVNKNEIIANSEMEIQNLTNQLSTMDLERSEFMSAIEKSGAEAKNMISKVQELTETSLALENKIHDIEDSMKASNEAAAAKITELTTSIETKEKELENKTSTITHLMDEVKTMSDARSKLEITVQKLKQELVEEKDSAGEREKRLGMKLEQLEISVKNKEKEISKNMSVIMELRSDKERLNKTIQNMQKTIDNVQKELTRPAISMTQSRIEPEQDDNAVMLTPTPANKKFTVPENFRTELGPPAPPPRKEYPNNDSLFNFLSDNSMDGGDNIHASFMNHRFEAIGRAECVSPGNASSGKRRRGASAQGGLRSKPQPPNEDELMSLSQLKEAGNNKPRFFKSKRHEKTKK